MIEGEWGTAGNLRFARAEEAKMCDSEGKEMLCICGQPAASFIAGKEAFQVFCSNCMPVVSVNLAYEPPKESDPRLKIFEHLKDV
jgi:hypothetical protein